MMGKTKGYEMFQTLFAMKTIRDFFHPLVHMKRVCFSDLSVMEMEGIENVVSPCLFPR